MDLDGYIQGWRDRSQREQSEIAHEAAVARAALPIVRAILRRRGAKRIWLIGSLADDTFHHGSDIDVMAEGLEERAAWEAAGEAAEQTGVSVDVLRAESLTSEWRRHHERFGELLGD